MTTERRLAFTLSRGFTLSCGLILASAWASPRATRESRPAALSFAREVVSKRKGLRLRLGIQGEPIAGRPLVFRVYCTGHGQRCDDIAGGAAGDGKRSVTAHIDLEMPEHAHSAAMPYTVGQNKGGADAVTFAGPVTLHMPGWWRVTAVWLEGGALIDAAVFNVDVEP